MGRGKKKNKRGKKSQPLSGTGDNGKRKKPYMTTAKEGGLILLAVIAAGGAGAALGKHSLIAGTPLTFYGIHKDNPYIIAAGLGLTTSNGFQKPGKQTTSVNGFDMKQIAEEAKVRVGTFFQNFKEKLYLPNTLSQSTD